MGSISRSNRCERFVEEFGTDYIAKNAIHGFDKDTQYLAEIDGWQEVMHHIDISLPDGDTQPLLVPGCVFDPEGGNVSLEDTVEHLSDRLGITKDEVKRRLIKAKLFDEGDFNVQSSG